MNLPPAFLNQPLNRQMGALAANLARVASSARKVERAEVVPPMLIESIAFIEWIAPRHSPEIGAMLADLQVMLGLWQASWPAIQHISTQRTLLAFQSQKWSDQLLDYSGLLNDDPTPDPVAT